MKPHGQAFRMHPPPMLVSTSCCPSWFPWASDLQASRRKRCWQLYVFWLTAKRPGHKSEVRVRMSKAKLAKVELPGGEFVVKLPPNPNDASLALQNAAFANSVQASPPWTLMEISNIARDIKLRTTKGQASPMTSPDAGAFWSAFQSVLTMAHR